MPGHAPPVSEPDIFYVRHMSSKRVSWLGSFRDEPFSSHLMAARSPMMLHLIQQPSVSAPMLGLVQPVSEPNIVYV